MEYSTLTEIIEWSMLVITPSDREPIEIFPAEFGTLPEYALVSGLMY
jgi:hypothetical protein